MDDNVVRLWVNGRKIEPGMNAQIYTLRGVTRLPTGGWTKFLRSTALHSFRPLWKFSWPNGEQVYVSGMGEVIQYTATMSRFWAYLGAIPHWFYFTPLRKHQPEWRRFVIWTSGAGTIAAIPGTTIGMWSTRPQNDIGMAELPPESHIAARIARTRSSDSSSESAR
jgi:hypothetical protein